MSDKLPVFTPSDVMSIIKPYLPQLSVEDEGDKIRLVFGSVHSRTFWICLTSSLGGLAIYIANEHTSSRRLRCLAELEDELRAVAYSPLEEFRGLLAQATQK